MREGFGTFCMRLMGAGFLGALVGGMLDADGLHLYARIGSAVGILIGIPLLMWADKKK